MQKVPEMDEELNVQITETTRRRAWNIPGLTRERHRERGGRAKWVFAGENFSKRGKTKRAWLLLLGALSWLSTFQIGNRQMITDKEMTKRRTDLCTNRLSYFGTDMNIDRMKQIERQTTKSHERARRLLLDCPSWRKTENQTDEQTNRQTERGKEGLIFAS